MKRRRSECCSPLLPSSMLSCCAAASPSALEVRRGAGSASAAALLLLLAVINNMKGDGMGTPLVTAFQAPSFDNSNHHHRMPSWAFDGGLRRRPGTKKRTGLGAFVAAEDSRRRAPASSVEGNAAASSVATTTRDVVASMAVAGTPSSTSSSKGALPKELLVPQTPSSALDSLVAVLGAAMLVTSNTIGAGCLVLPELTAGPGLGVSTIAFVLSYIINLLSGLTLAHVAIEQHHQQSSDPASVSSCSSSFQDLAKSTLGESAGTIVSSVSLLVNAAVLSFDVGQVGHIAASASTASSMPMMGPALSTGFAVAVAALLANVPASKLSGVASVCVTLLLGSFAGLLAESAPHLLHDPLAPFMMPGTSTDTMGALGEAAPVIFMSMVYQNIVPTIVKMLDYDAPKTTAALSLGSLLPMGLYLLWCCAGGMAGESPDALTTNPLLAVFTLTTLLGSAIGTGLSLTEEVQSLRSPAVDNLALVDIQQQDSCRPPQWTTVAASVGLPLVTALALGEGRIIEALEWAGSFGSPLLYGVLPATMALQRRQQGQRQQVPPSAPSASWIGMTTPRPSSPPFVYSWQSAGALGLLSAGFIGQELVQQAVAAVSS